MFRLSNPCKIIVSRMCPKGIARYSKAAATPPGGCETKGKSGGCSELTNPCPKSCDDGKSKSKEDPQYPKAKQNRLCYENPCCPDASFAYDAEFRSYLDTLKGKKIGRTWWECPPKRAVKKFVCDLTKPPQAPPDQRSRVQTGLEAPSKPKSNKKCPKLTMPGCCPPVYMRRDKGGCKVTRPANCKKREAPFCAFSECKKCKPRKLHPTECECLLLRSFCGLLNKEGKLVLKYATKKALKPPKLPEHCP